MSTDVVPERWDSAGSAEKGNSKGDVRLLQQLAKSRQCLLVQAQGCRLACPKLKFGIDNMLLVTSSQSLNLSNLTLWFAFLFKVGVIMLAAALCLRYVWISGLNLVKTCQAEVGDRCSKNAAVTEIPSKSNLLADASQASLLQRGNFKV